MGRRRGREVSGKEEGEGGEWEGEGGYGGTKEPVLFLNVTCSVIHHDMS